MYRKLKTPLSHLTNNMPFELDLEAMEKRAATLLIERKIDETLPTGKAQEDACTLVLLAKSLVDDVLTLNAERTHPRDLCPLCAGYTWGRPGQPPNEDYTKRQCHRCGHVRPEPEGD